jgi:uncharacterized protein YdhG (YjbR/CyaY superfamily)
MAAKKQGFSAEEKAAMKERAKELKAEERANKSREDGAKDVLGKIGEMSKEEAKIAQGIHDLISTKAPDLMPKLWYGMPAYAKDGKILCFFQSADKFETRYSTLGFNDIATLDDGVMWPTAYAIRDWNETIAAKIEALIKKAVG